MEYLGIAEGESNDTNCHNSLSHNDKVIEEKKSEEKEGKPTQESSGGNSDGGAIQEKPKESIDFKVIYNKRKIDVSFDLDGTIADLKTYLQNIITVPKAMQKVMIKVLARDEQTLRSLGVTNGTKVMIVGSKLDDVLAVSIPTKHELQDEAAGASSKEPLSQQKIHRKVLDKGIPEDAMPGILESNEPLPNFPLSGMLNKLGGKVRLTFKLEQDQLWIGTKERTDKIPMNSIRVVHTEPIHDHPEYHMMALQLGPTDASRYWIYWVPAQYTKAIKEAILGTWAYF
ncbi:ubiquitin domain-containing protein UBFD1-like isoform X2 [Venturia canescens]|uniref:ubiquitin domain-containing protein UBFD1-like isoform X2 n=1 Tax=Venturia canescens TaxID=32260 RepID=UPI001C9D3351|nr:ubiquitin domain-containing protein UBFD1-like isoform X2 [Venturia canescens]